MKLWLTFLLTLQTLILVRAQSLPEPFYQFPLDGFNPTLWKDHDGIGHNGESDGTLTPITDRFGIANNAIKFSHDAYIYQGGYPTVINKEFNITVSFWTKLNSTHSFPSDFNPYNPGTSEKGRYFSLTTDYKSGGLARLKDNALLGAERTVDVSGTKKPWYLWLNKPAILEQDGWYHIVMVAAKNYTRVYIYKPNGSKVCSYNYMGNYYDKVFSIGKKASFPASEEFVSSAFIMDDFKLWTSALTEQQVDELNAQETNVVDGVYRISLAAATSPNKYVHTSSQSQSGGANIELYQLQGQEQFAYAYDWQFIKRSDNVYSIKMNSSPKYLDTDFNNPGNSDNIYLNHNDAHTTYPEAQWQLISTGQSEHEYYIKLKNTNYYMHTSSQSTANSANIELYELLPGQENGYKWKLDRVFNPKIDVEGIYEVQLSASSSPPKYIHTSNHSQSNSANIELYQLQGEEQYAYAYKWDFLRQPDNSYRIKMHNSDKYVHTSNQSTGNSANIELYDFLPNGERGYEWVLEPTGQTDEYYIRLTGTTDRYMHTSRQSTANSANIELYELLPGQENGYKWKLKKVDNPRIEIEGTYTVESAGSFSPLKFMHTSSQSTANSANIELYQLQGQEQYAYAYQWDFLRQPDNSYRIKMRNTDKYVHTSSQATGNGANIEIYDFLPNGERGYEWILEPQAGTNDVFMIRLAATTNRYLRTHNYSYSNSTNIELFEWTNGGQVNGYYWKLAPVSANSAKSSNNKTNNTELSGIDKEIVEESINIYPNPSNGTLNISLNLEQSDTVNFDFYDLQGRQVYSENRKITQGNQTLILRDLKTQGFLENQLYLLKITTSTGKVMTSKVLFE